MGSMSDLNPIHIGLFAPALPVKGMSNGIVAYVRIMRDALRALGHKVSIIDADQIERADGTIADLPVYRGLPSRVRTLLEGWQGGDATTAYVRTRLLCGLEALKADGAQIVEIEETWGWAARLVDRGVPVVLRLHGPHVFAREQAEASEVDRQREAAELTAFQRVQAVTAPSSPVLQSMAEQGSVQLTRVIRNPVPLPAVQWDAARAEPDQLLFVGRFDLLKGADVVVRAFAKAFEQRPSLKLVMVGPDRGLGGDVHFEAFAQSIAPDARAAIDYVGEKTPEEIMELRLRSTLAIVGSRFETFGYTAFEAQAIGMPLLMTDTLGPRGILRDGENARIVPVDDAEGMARTILDMMADPVSLARMGAAGRNFVATKLDPMGIAEATASLYRDVLLINSKPQRRQVELNHCDYA